MCHILSKALSLAAYVNGCEAPADQIVQQDPRVRTSTPYLGTSFMLGSGKNKKNTKKLGLHVQILPSLENSYRIHDTGDKKLYLL